MRIDLPFYLGVYEVTQGQYAKVMAGKPGAGPAAGGQPEEFPAGDVSWLDAVAFCNRLSEIPAERAARRKYRLPTEAEWEYACRAGTTGRGPPMSRFWYAGNSSGASHPVGGKGPNAWQLCDMLGNVSEWCLNRADEDYFRQVPISTDMSSGQVLRPVRGGSWKLASLSSRPANRDEASADTRRADIGFRVACVYGGVHGRLTPARTSPTAQ